MTLSENMDPYSLLDVSYDASDQAIHEAFLVKMSPLNPESPEARELIQAYSMIRNQAGRNAFLWDSIRSFLASPFPPREKSELDMEALAKELAFLSDWEIMYV